MDIRTYNELGSSDETWYCSNCTFPFNFTDSFFEESTTGDINASLQSSLSGSTDGVRNIFPKVLFLNARSIRNKVFDLQALLLMDSFDVVVIVETWLDRNYEDFELKLEGYNIFRKDRCNRRGGGVLIAIRNHISCIHRSDLEVKLEMIALEIRPNPTICVLLSAFYRPPDADELFLSQFREFLVKYSRTGLSNLVVTGDFNFPHIDWNLGCPTKPHPETEDFCNMLDDLFLVQKNLHATRDLRNSGPSGNILDLVLTNNDILVEDVVVHPHVFDSDHDPLTFKSHAEMRRPNNIQRKVYCYKKADFKGLQETLQSIPWNLVTCDNCIDTGLIKFQHLLFAAVNQHIPQITLKRRSRPPWICNDIMKLIRKKRKLWKQVKSNGSPGIFLKFKELRKETKRLINTSYYNYLKSLSGKLQDNPKHFWSFYSVKSKTKRIPETVINDNVCSTDTSSKVELFNKFFHSIYSIDSVDVNNPTTDVVNRNLLLNVTTTAF